MTADNNTVKLLVEIRARLISSLVILFSLFAILLYFANNLYTLLALPLLKFLPQGHLIATQIISPFFVPFKLAFMAALLLSVPVFLYQVWSFVAPALYQSERRFFWPILFISAGLFYLGIAFAYFVIFPLLFNFLAHVAPEGVVLSPDITEYLNFAMKLLLIFGCLFELPIIMMILVATNVITRQRLVRSRSYAIVGAFILGMLLAPPDIFSQTLLAIPIWLLYEVGLLLTKFIKLPQTH